mmetsp:Transcript_36083/g.79300  ORF Transcript_36083/g.79300 Transcript_36083/m.79300 type:complete len:205 (+) Transcript_36083:514-1128(+)
MRDTGGRLVAHSREQPRNLLKRRERRSQVVRVERAEQDANEHLQQLLILPDERAHARAERLWPEPNPPLLRLEEKGLHKLRVSGHGLPVNVLVGLDPNGRARVLRPVLEPQEEAVAALAQTLAPVATHERALLHRLFGVGDGDLPGAAALPEVRPRVVRHRRVRRESGRDGALAEPPACVQAALAHERARGCRWHSCRAERGLL